MKKDITALTHEKPWTFAIAIWVIILFLLLVNNVDQFGLMVWTVIVPFSILIVLIHYFYLIPFAQKPKFWSKKYLYNLFPILLTLSFIVSRRKVAKYNKQSVFISDAVIPIRLRYEFRG